MNIDKFLTKNGSIKNTKTGLVLTLEEYQELLELTKFLELDPTTAQRIKAIKLNIQEHSRCVCGNLLPYSPNKNDVFKTYCCMSCAKKNKYTLVIEAKFKQTLTEKKTKHQLNLDSAIVLDKLIVIDFFTKNLEKFKNGGTSGNQVLNDNPDIHKSLLHYTEEHNKFNGRIYELLYGKGECVVCGNKTLFNSLKSGFSSCCAEHRKHFSYKAGESRGARGVERAIEKLKSFDNFSEFKIINIPKILNEPFKIYHESCKSEFDLCLKNGSLETYVLHCLNCKNITISKQELQIQELLKQNNIYFIPQYKVDTKKLDVYIPEFDLAIEHHGPDHSFGIDEFSRFNNANKETDAFHNERHNLCLSNNIRLLHIFEWEWAYKTKRNIWKSIILNNLKLSHTIYGRNCSIKYIDGNVAKNFLDENHLQGELNATIYLGLLYKDELVSVMTFGSPRFAKDRQWELLRFCNKLNTNIVGGASRLFKKFIKDYDPKDIISYCDRRVFDGKLYENLGFDYSHISDPNYWYYKNSEVLSRYVCQKHKLKALLTKFDPTLTERANMFNNGYRIMYDCGNKVYVWNR